MVDEKFKLSDEFMELFNGYSDSRKHAGKTRAKELAHVRVMCQYLGRDFMLLTRVDGERYIGFLQEKLRFGGLSPRTVRDKMTVLNAICEYGVEKGYLDENILAGYDAVTTRDEPSTARIPSVSDCDRILESVRGSDLFLVFVLALRMAFSTSDICSLKRSWVGTDVSGCMTVRFPPSRGYPAGRLVYVPDDVAPYLKEALAASGSEYVFLNTRGKKLIPHRLEEYVRRALSAVQLEGGPYSLKDFRNRALLQMLGDGADSSEVGYYAGLRERRMRTLAGAPVTSSRSIHMTPADYSCIRIVAGGADNL